MGRDYAQREALPLSSISGRPPEVGGRGWEGGKGIDIDRIDRPSFLSGAQRTELGVDATGGNRVSSTCQ